MPIPIKDLTAVAGWPLTYGSNGAPEGPSEESELVVEALQRAGFVLCGRTNTPEFGPLTVAENTPLRHHAATPGTPAARSGGSSRRRLGGGRRRHVPDRPRQRRRRLDPHPRRLLRPGRPEDQPRPRPAPRPDLDGRRGRGRRSPAPSPTPPRSSTRPPAPTRSPGTTRPPPQRPFAEEVGADPGKLRIGLMAEAPLGIPTDPACVAAARDAAALLEELGHEVVEVEVPTISEELMPAFIDDDRRRPRRLRRASTGTKVEPHNRHAYEAATERDQRLRLRRRGADAGAALAPRGRPLGPRLRRPADPDLGDPAAARRARPRGPARRPRAAGLRGRRLGLASPPSATSPACRRSRCRCTGPTRACRSATMLTGAPFDEATLIAPRRPARSGAPLGAAHPGRSERLESGG